MTFSIDLERDELASRLGGGFPEGALVVIEGEYGSGKSILLERLLYGFLDNALKVTMVSTELTTPHFIEQMYTLDYAVEEHILSRKLLFLPVYPVIGFRGRRTDLMDRLLNAKRMYESDVIALDAFSSLVKDWARALPPGTPPNFVTSRIEDALYLFKLLNAQGKTVILTLQPGDMPDDISAALKSAADVYITMQIDVVGNTVSRSLFVRRFERAEATVADIINFRVEPKVGFVVEIKSVS